MKFRITTIEFDTDGNKSLAKRLAKEYVGTYFEASSEADADARAANIISDKSGWCIFNITYEAQKSSKHSLAPFCAGTRVISRDGKQRGRLTGTRRLCSLDGCTGERLTTRWDNGKISYPCTKGMTFNESKRGYFWRIG